MKKYQVQYKYNTKTFVDDFEANSYQDILSFFDDISACEVIEIREYQYEDNSYPIDDGNYIKSVSVGVSNSTSKFSIKLPKVKTTVDYEEIKNFMITYLKIGNESLADSVINLTFR